MTLLVVSLLVVATNAQSSSIWDTLFGVAKTIAASMNINIPTIPSIPGFTDKLPSVLITPTGTAAPDDSMDDAAATQAPLTTGLGDLFGSFFNPTTSGTSDPSNGWLSTIFGGLMNTGGTTTPDTSGDTDPDTSGTSDPDTSGNNEPDTGGSTKQGVGEPCRSVAGTCLDSSVSSCAQSFLTGKCPGPTEVRCCPSAKTSTSTSTGSVSSDPVSSGSGSCASYGGLVFPLKAGSLSEISVNWGGSRDGGARCHAGLDIYTGGARIVQAMSDGQVTNIMKNWYTCSGKSIDAIFVYHSSGPLAGYTINYGEVNPGTYSVGVGSSVSRGQQLATAINCGMLHFELYRGRQTVNQHWKPKSGSVGSGCAGNSLSTKPSALADPRPLIRCTMPSGARFRNGIGFLNNDVAKSQQDLEVEGTEPSTLPIGGIVAIVVCFLVVCAAVVAIAVCLVARKRRAAASTSLPTTGTTISNAAYSTSASASSSAPAAPADFGHFKCAECQKEYSYENDLREHRALRHGL